MSISKKLNELQTRYKKFVRAVIQPSVRLNCVNVHKLKDKQTCDRLYFWRWVLNLEPSKLSLPFWFGTMVHKAMELYVKDLPLKAIFKHVQKESNIFKSRYALIPEQTEEMAIQYKVMKAIIEVYVKHIAKNNVPQKTLATERPFKYTLDKTPVVLVGTIDWHGLYKKKKAIKEYKTAAIINEEYFSRLAFDKQLNGYAVGHKVLTGDFPEVCPYVVFRKPQIRCRQNETAEQFIIRLTEDLITRKDWYYVSEPIEFSRSGIQSVLMDIEWLVYDLFCKYEELSTEQLLSPDNWPRNEGACFNYGICPYFGLCKNTAAFRTFLPFYQMREIRYKEEKTELGKVFEIKFSKKENRKYVESTELVGYENEAVLDKMENY